MKARSTLAAWAASAALTAVFGLALAQSPAAQPKPADAPRALSDSLPIPPPPKVVGKAWILMDSASGNVLAGENIDMQVEPASITKVMTSYVVAAEMAGGKVKPTDPVMMSENAWREGGAGTDGSYSGFEVNKTAPLEQMEKGMVIQSGNDAAIALAEHIAGSTDAFASLMNQYGQRIGMKNTNFVNPHGLPAEGHVTTVRDLAVLGRALIRDFPEAYSYNKIKSFTVGPITQANRNLLLWRDPSVDGIKTGHTSSAGYGLMASAKRGDQRLISVVVGSTSEKQRADDSQALLNWGFRFFETHRLFEPAKAIATQKVWKGEENELKLGLTAPMLITVPRGRYDRLKSTMDVPSTLVAPIKKGQQIGTVKVTLDGKPVAQRPLVALEAVEEAGFFKRLWHELLMWWES
ncbi:D-alanyl-D-alanine carboxypeptidase family protein [Lysobacter korlensis]|uniref:serine-type D-Ala-D-Ala carboxypeptidase n=1 Tax=Lysobacter korlensis TaxID=553636 RepID=A0ABV6RI47_9GAMM